MIDAPEGFDVYGQWADLEFEARIRGMERFAGVDELVAQMTLDVEHARKIVAGSAAGEA